MSTDKMTFGPYSLYEKLGSHRRHHVYRAIHDPTGQTFACKLVNISKKVEPQTATQKVQLEARILQRLEHPNLVKIVDAGALDGKMFIVMELVQGESLAAILSRRGKLPWDLATEYARQIAEGIDYIHKQELVHLKLNPDKILIGQDGSPKIGDLRLNRAKKRRWDEAQHRVLDVAAYMAPEQMTNEGGTHKSDIYTVGVLLYEMITGRLPFEPETLPRLLKAKLESKPTSVSSQVIDCPSWLDELIMQMISPNPKLRPHSMHAVVAALREVERMRSNTTSMTEQLTRGFNPLTAGKDKTEARRILGKSPNAFESVSDEPSKIPPWWGILGIAFSLLVTLTIMIGGIYFAMQPPSEEKLYKRAIANMAKDENEQTLLAAKRNLLPLIENYPDSEHIDEAKSMMNKVIAKLAERRMRRRHRFGRDPKNDVEAQCLTAWQLLELGDDAKALEIYREAIQDENGNDEIPIPEDYVFDADESEVIQFRILAMIRAEELEAKLEPTTDEDTDEATADGEQELDPEKALQVRRLNIEEKIAQAKRLEIEGKIVESRRIIKTLIDGFGDDPDVADLIDPLRDAPASDQ